MSDCAAPEPVRRLLAAFAQAFGPGQVSVAEAPGRVNLIGEHTDYNGGYVLPIAIDRAIRIACRKTPGRTVDLVSLDFDGRAHFDLSAIAFHKDVHWLNYPQGVARMLLDEGYALSGFQGVIQGDVPVGAGLSSSAAFEVASALAFCLVSDVEIEPRSMAQLCQRAENEFVGVRCGIMDQFVCLFGRKDRAVLLDCTTLEHRLVPLDGRQAKIVVCDTGVRHSLASTEYNKRRGECERAFEILSTRMPGINTYKDVTPASLEKHADALDRALLMRARHVVMEDQRVLDSVAALGRGDLGEFGRLLDASHDSLRDDYQVSCPELDLMVDLAREVEGTYGSRMTGGGFGGCTVSLVVPHRVDAFREHVAAAYRKQTGVAPAIYVSEAAPGATSATYAV